ncbi:hypothetical protein PT277_05125 [Acetobacteraceae bacterium ESL0709]|nr:hypothetical protein [Acetobacteraceae bacterium ESL0697]MDF7678077.1 hypothetical protein [Acetobacteraceae bacterium ESL0709]
MRGIILWIWLGVLLGGCTSPRPKTVCPTLVTYSKTDQQTLMTELMKTSDKPQLVRWLGDYIGLRDQVRACQKATS